MKVSELSELSDVSIASIKFYLRERLLFAGTATSATRSDYDETHLARLRLIRALIEVGGLSVAAARGVLAAIDDSAMPIVDVFGIAQRAASVALTPSAQPSAQPSAESLERVDRLKSERGWQTSELDPGALITARVLDTFAAIGRGDLLALLPSYAAAAEMVAHADLAAVTASGPDRRPMVETVVVGTALGDALFAGLRRIAQEDMARRLGLPGSSLSPRTTDNSSRNVER
jgi:DNA-binding transcriptional MerR regulator